MLKIIWFIVQIFVGGSNGAEISQTEWGIDFSGHNKVITLNCYVSNKSRKLCKDVEKLIIKTKKENKKNAQ